MAMLIGIAFQIIKLADGQKETVPRNIIDQHVTNVRASDINYSLLEFRDPVPMGLIKGQKSPRAKRSIHREKIPRSEVAMESPYSSIVYISVGCIGTLVSPIHVLTAAHCIHDGVKIRKGHEMNRLRIGKYNSLYFTMYYKLVHIFILYYVNYLESLLPTYI